ncbi:MAG: hypothetical protein LUF30_11530 [Lachnospiraceae bacterium]|nr:hypothetical protein [Lachnospiraceae bacterium]
MNRLKMMKMRVCLLLITICALAVPVCAQEEESVPYTIKVLRNDLPVFDGAGYDYSCVNTVAESGTYTIVEEEEDEEGILWGKLKSGIGWVDLAEAVSEEAAQVPVTVIYADVNLEELLTQLELAEYFATDSDYLVKMLFRSNERLTDVTFSLLEYGEDGEWFVSEELYTLAELEPEMGFLAGVEFYGDMTAYGVSFTDEDGAERCYAAHISGRNGALLLDEYGISEEGELEEGESEGVEAGL